VGTGCAWPERGAGFTAFLRTTTVGGVPLTTFLGGILSPPSQTTRSSSCILPTAHTQGNAHSWWEYMAAYRQRDFFRFCGKFFRSSEMLKLCGTKTTRYCTSQVVFSNFATGRAAGNGSTPAGGSPITVLPQEGCVVIPDSGCGRPASGKRGCPRPRRPELCSRAEQSRRARNFTGRSIKRTLQRR
jgi:hypothetical protein